ncbi:hypothetical protein SAMN06309944_0767 [Micrococcales bacterium KH10]|nr:hypothetical protein SAMN06309944_0767 [Micrococcales bacterium KH10]
MSFSRGRTPNVPTAPSGQVIANFDSYVEAQRAVDYLSDKAFPVQTVTIVGSDLRMVERVTGRLTYPKVAVAGMVSGAWMGLFVGLLFMLFVDDGYQAMISAVIVGVGFGLLFSVISYSFARGKRDFTSASQIVAAQYSVLCLDPTAIQARELLRSGGFHTATGAVGSHGTGAPSGPSSPQPSAPQYPVQPPSAPQQPQPPMTPPSGNPFAAPPGQVNPSGAPVAEVPAAGPVAPPQSTPQSPPRPNRGFVDEHGRPRYGVRLGDVQADSSAPSKENGTNADGQTPLND